MRNILIVGRPRAGKTSEAKRIATLIGFPLVVNDVNGEWGQRPLDLSKFLDIADQRNGMPTTFVWEEATSYLDAVAATGQDKKRTVKALTRRFHTKHVNVLLFHALRAVPVWVMDYTDQLILFKTNDRPSLIDRKFQDWEAVTEARARIQASPDVHAHETVSIFGA